MSGGTPKCSMVMWNAIHVVSSCSQLLMEVISSLNLLLHASSSDRPCAMFLWRLQEYLVAVRGVCSELTSTRLQQLTEGQVQRLPDFLAGQQIKHEQSAQDLDTFGGMVIGAVAAACHATLEQLETRLSQVCLIPQAMQSWLKCLFPPTLLLFCIRGVVTGLDQHIKCMIGLVSVS